MNNLKVEVESREVDDFIREIEDDETRRQIILEGLKSGAKVLQKNTQELFKSRMGTGALHFSRFIKKPFYEGVKVIVDKAYNETIVSILSDYRMRFYEKGTKDRKTKKGYRRGQLQSLHFFKDARSNSENEIDNAINSSIDLALRIYLL